MTRRVHGGGADLKLHESADFFNRFDSIRTQLLKDPNIQKESNLTNKFLSQLTAQLIQFQNDFCGKDAPKPQIFTRLPARLLRDYSPKGSLYVILNSCFQTKARLGLRRFDLSNPQKKDVNVELFMSIEKDLQKSGHLKRPSVYISPELADQVPRLKDIVKRHNGSLASSAATASHVVVPDPDASLKDDEEEVEYCRTLEKRGGLAFVHWWYFPDSYDEWIPANEVEGDEPEVPTTQTKWRVNPRFINDLEVYNEWMNEIDYEISEEKEDEDDEDQGISETVKTPASNKKRKKTDFDSESKSSKKQRKDPVVSDKKRKKLETVEPMEEVPIIKKEKESAKKKKAGGNGKARKTHQTDHPAVTMQLSRHGEGYKLLFSSLDDDEDEDDFFSVSDVDSDIWEMVNEPTAAQKELVASNFKTPLKKEKPDRGTRTKEESIEKRERVALREAGSSHPAVERKKRGEVEPLKDKVVLSNISQGMDEEAAESAPVGRGRGRASKADSTPAPSKENAPPTPAAATDAEPPAPPMYPIILPSCTSWFKMDSIHEIERRSLPEFFANKYPSKTPQVYKDYRDFCINLYRQNPRTYLSATACRRNLAGDACAIMRVHAFLEHWGLINFNVNPHTRPLASFPVSTANYPVITDNQTAASAFPKMSLPSQPTTAASGFMDSSLSLRGTVLAAAAKGQERPNCTSCGGVCGLAYYKQRANGASSSIFSNPAPTSIALTSPAQFYPNHYSTDESGREVESVVNAPVVVPYSSSSLPSAFGQDANMQVLCLKCFADGNFPSTLSSADFEKVELPRTAADRAVAEDDPTAKASVQLWSEEETVKLLEAVERFSEDWEKVAAHVGTKSKDECVLHFIQLPIEEPFLDVNKPGLTNSTAGVPLVPFADTSNPLMAQVAFLASVVNPTVAAAAAKAALTEINRQKRFKSNRLSPTQAESNQVEPVDSTTVASDEASVPMDIDPNFVDQTGGNGTNGIDLSTEQSTDMGSRDSGNQVPPQVGTELAVNVQVAAATGLAAAAVKAQELASIEEEEISRLVQLVVEAQLRKLELKLQHFEEFEEILTREREQIERSRQQLYAERLSMAASRGQKYQQPLASGNVLRNPQQSNNPAMPASYLATASSPAPAVPVPSGSSSARAQAPPPAAPAPLLSTINTNTNNGMSAGPLALDGLVVKDEAAPAPSSIFLSSPSLSPGTTTPADSNL
eukprot:GILJ01006788.1.p1 GENE.GILJ01006788.1~~GILJ01006788.1.p1  ORF type:complete len:1205 (-),score=267.37 GILJ01006788.1:229-3843(-)